MAKTQRYITTSFWPDPFIRSLYRDAKLFYMYLLTNSDTNIAGIYEFDRELAKINLDLDDESMDKIIEILEARRKVFFLEGWVIIKSWPKHQKWDCRPTIKTGIDKCLKQTPKSILYKAKSIGYLYPIPTEYLPDTYRPSYLDLEFDLDKDIDAVSQTQNPESDFTSRESSTQSGSPASPIFNSDTYQESVEQADDAFPPDDIVPDSEFPAPERRDDAPTPGFKTTPIDELFRETVDVWNFNELPKARYMPTITMSQKQRDIVVAAYQGRERNEVRDKVQEYAGNLPEPKWQYRSLMAFLEKGLDREYAKRSETQKPKQKAKVFLCPTCGVPLKGSACPKCYTNYGADGKAI